MKVLAAVIGGNSSKDCQLALLCTVHLILNALVDNLGEFKRGWVSTVARFRRRRSLGISVSLVLAPYYFEHRKAGRPIEFRFGTDSSPHGLV
jgi:hypothetical protein